MANKKINMPFDQIPHVVLACKELTSDQKILMIYLYKILKDKEICIYSNSRFSENTGIPLRTVVRGLEKLHELRFISKKGRGYGRKIYAGEILINTAILAVSDSVESATMALSSLGESAIVARESATMAFRKCHNGVDTNKSLLKDINNKGEATPTPTLLLIFSDVIKKQIIDANKENPIQSKFIKTHNDLFSLMDYLVRERDQKFSEISTLKNLMGFLRSGTLDVPQKWIDKRLSKLNEGLLDYQYYVSGTKNDMKIGILPKDFPIKSFDEWKHGMMN